MRQKGEGWRPSAATLIMLALPHRTCKKPSVDPRGSGSDCRGQCDKYGAGCGRSIYHRDAEPTPRQTSQLWGIGWGHEWSMEGGRGVPVSRFAVPDHPAPPQTSGYVACTLPRVYPASVGLVGLSR